jgi:uncharacterized membrane protein
MSGPFLPLYGSGAICVLFASLPFQEHWSLVYLVGAISATLLEYVTGVCMEALFKVRYWDYSYKKFNFQGHICLTSTLAWGAITVALIYGFHRPVEYLVLLLPDTVASVIALLFSIYFSIDFARSFHVAIDLRNMLKKAAIVKQEIAELQHRLESIEHAARNNIGELQERANQKREQRELRNSEHLKNVQEQFESLKKKLPSDMLEKYREELTDIHVHQAVLKEKISNYFGRDKAKLLRRNPYAISKKYQEQLEEFKEAREMKKGKQKKRNFTEEKES